MADVAETGPDYERPPVVETVLGVQFNRLIRMKNAHLGAFWKTLDRVQWPAVADVPPLLQQFERFDASDEWARGVQLKLTQDPACRLQIRNTDDDRMIQIQNGRIHLNWLGQDGGSYPRFRQVRREFVSVFEQFAAFVAEESLGQVQPNQWEVTYVNQIPQGTVWNTPADWGFFKPLSSVPTIDNVIDGESFGGQWHFEIPRQRGRLHVEWRHEKTPEDGRGETPEELIRLTLTARGPVGARGLSSAWEGLDLGRSTIVNAFQRLMTDEANRYWGSKHADR